MKSIARTLVAFVLVAAGGFAPPSGIAAPAAAKANGRIVWSRFPEPLPTEQGLTSARIVSSNPDGSDLRVLSHPPTGVSDIAPVPSPDGKRVVFERDIDDASQLSQIVMVNADGSGEHVVDLRCVKPCVNASGPGWTPDGTHLTFTRGVGPFIRPGQLGSAALWVAKDDGTDLQRLSAIGIDGVYEDYRARYALDGGFITFVRLRIADFASAVFRMNMDKTHVRQLTPWGLYADFPDLSQATTGSTNGLVVFDTRSHPTAVGSTDIATVPATCISLADCTSKIRYVTRNAVSLNPSWAPDGRRITLTLNTGIIPPQIMTVDPDGSHPQLVSTFPSTVYANIQPSWSVKP